VGYPHWSSPFLKDCTQWKEHVERTLVGAACEEPRPVGRTHVAKFVEDCLLWV